MEHTSINPNKAAHIGHLRNSILGDTLVRLLRAAGYQVDVQNYIDNTGVQVADVVVGLKYLPQDSVPGLAQNGGLDLAGVQKLISHLSVESAKDPGNKELLIDYYCWDLYASVSNWYSATTGNEEEAARRQQIRRDTLHALEAGDNEIRRSPN